jgi:hypothetical protein
VETLRGAFARLQTLRREEGGPRRLFTRIHHAGPDLSREEVAAAVAILPMISTTLMGARVENFTWVTNERDRLGRLLARVDKVKSTEFDALERYWKGVWAGAHLTVILAEVAREKLDLMVAEVPTVPVSLDLGYHGLVGLSACAPRGCTRDSARRRCRSSSSATPRRSGSTTWSTRPRASSPSACAASARAPR